MNRPPTLSRGELGGTGLAVTPICFGTSPLASMAQLYGYAVEEEQAVATVLAVFNSPVNISNLVIGNGLAEFDADSTATRLTMNASSPGISDGLIANKSLNLQTLDFSSGVVHGGLPRVGVARVIVR